MTLRSRLRAFFLLIVVVPLAIAGILLQAFVGREIAARTDAQLRAASATVAAVYRERAERAADAAAAVARRMTSTPEATRSIERLRLEAGVDFVVVAGPGARVLASALGPADFPLSAGPGAAEIAAAAPRRVLRASIRLTGGGEQVAMMHAGWYLDRAFARRLAAAAATPVALLDGERISAASTTVPRHTAARAGTAPAGRPFDAGGGRRGMIAGSGVAGFVVLAETGNGLGALRAGAAALVAAALVVAAGLGSVLARVIAGPLARLARGAMAVAEGDLEHRVEIEGDDEVARVGAAFNSMTDRLRSSREALARSDRELRAALERLGANLRATADMDTMMHALLESATAALGAASGIAYRIEGQDLARAATLGEVPPGAMLPAGRGIAGRVAWTGIPLRVPSDWGSPPSPGPGEPACVSAIAVPLARGTANVGVLALYDRDDERPFSPQDLATLTAFAGQASVAIDNVFLRREAEWAAITDGLTGVWNRRYLQMTLAKEVERAARFDRELSLVMLDIDHFKAVNDAHGHARGDEVLVETCERLAAAIRKQVDTLARYGGEEFVVVLPETGASDAAEIAERLLASINKALFDGDPPLRLTVSAGVSTFPADGVSCGDLIAAADRALYAAKGSGRNRVATFGEGLDEAGATGAAS